MNYPALTILLGLLALLFFIAERCVGLFTWSRLEGLTAIRRSRRQAVETCLEEREIVSTAFALTGGLLLAVAGVIVGEWVGEPRTAILYVAGGALLTAWVLPEVIAWALRDQIMLYLVPGLYRVVGIPLRLLRMLTGQSSVGTPDNGEGEREIAPDAAGAGDAEAREFFREAVRLRHTPVREIMTPRTDMVSVSETATLQQAARICTESGNSRFPVYRGNRDQIIGVIHAKDLIPYAGRDQWNQAALQTIMRQPYFVPETKTIAELLEEFQRTSTHIGIVLDEYGGTAGLVTLEDVLEELIGEIHDEHEDVAEEEPLFRWVDETSAEVQAIMRVEEFNEEFDADLPDEEDFDTLGGFVTYALGKIPETGESFDYSNAQFTVVEADPRHVIRLKVRFAERPRPGERTG